MPRVSLTIDTGALLCLFADLQDQCVPLRQEMAPRPAELLLAEAHSRQKDVSKPPLR